MSSMLRTGNETCMSLPQSEMVVKSLQMGPILPLCESEATVKEESSRYGSMTSLDINLCRGESWR